MPPQAVGHGEATLEEALAAFRERTAPVRVPARERRRRVLELTPVTPSLEEIFISLTTGREDTA